MELIRWGVLGCGGIANLFARSLNALSEGHLQAGASRSPGKAAAFAEKYQIESAYEDYESLLTDPAIDAVYVATTHNFHYENVKLCLEHGKHVLCEKPFTVNAVQARELVTLAAEKKLFMMEAMWTRFLPAIVKMQELLAEGAIGEVLAVDAAFCAGGEFSKEHRMRNRDLAGGALLDLGVYPITFADIVFGELPIKVQSGVYLGDTQVDDRSFYQMEYPGGRFAQLSSSFTHRASNDARVLGSKGYIRVPMFWMTQGLEVCRSNEEPEIISCPIPDGEGFKYEIAHAMECIAAGKIESDIHPLSKTLDIMQIMDDLRAEWGLKYPGE